jgi:hypothetical protein
VAAVAPFDSDLAVVAIILSDGSVIEPSAPTIASRWTQGSISGADWILWWERRSYATAGEDGGRGASGADVSSAELAGPGWDRAIRRAPLLPRG